MTVFLLLLASLGLHSVLAVPTPDTTKACQILATKLPGILNWPTDAAFIKEQKNYWSSACREATPACILLPTSAEDVSIAVKILRDAPAARWTIKSGGHDPNVGHSSLKDGIVIALGKMKGAEYVADKGVVQLKPGGPWVDAVKSLEPYNVTVASGRIGNVGIGGFLLGGGLSFLSAQYGMAGDVSTLSPIMIE
jgi:FAD/FMN-containing dehydrogenase